MRLKLLLPVVAALGLGSMAPAQPATPAQTDSPLGQAAQEAAQAAEMLRAAVDQLDEALTEDDQVASLTRMIRAYEQGLSALRSGLRRAGVREQEIRTEFDARRDRLGRVLGVMTSMQKSPETMLLLHPAGPEASARAGMILDAVAPGLEAEAREMQQKLEEIRAVRAIQLNAANTLAQGLGQVQEARRLLASAVTDRSSLPVRFGKDPKELTALVQSADTLEAFASGITGMEQDVGAPMADFEGAQGSLPLPALGQVIRRYDEPDAAGVRRPGLVIATAPAALVTTPWPATIRYRGPLLDYGNVMIVEPARGYLLIFAGLAQVFGETGDVLAAGEPVGLMGGQEPPAQEFGAEFVADAAAGGGAGQNETLYVELRRGKETLDPAEWFVMNPIVGDTTQGGTGRNATGQDETE
ncbi:Septal ring factor EnvC, activator of murein hydrolases AmiA and AmiB [Paracoccus aminovorans]|uniref:Septal ring factor EnvC, activator of murein hydrolases AmiA and AmiB n=1 Tax=Paracoccus aminovorans TaxID=34004 RepID=A0A1I3A1R5_9RHOB|nr:peptidoglycan DD-metalloendopeptidase family protein [Paracoccus aminovorans]CQR85044.1 peptidase M23B [Paracoccus aminovorans]SFH43994.1 Septal ring factor EnvC, activator of murein hydrolases AmiA and AmiB [Paracoccus aminovorans]